MLLERVSRNVNGHLFLPTGGHRFSPLVAMISPQLVGRAAGLGQGLHSLAGGRLGEAVAVLAFGDCVRAFMLTSENSVLRTREGLPHSVPPGRGAVRGAV